jgi:hypothetical protein
VIDCVHRCALVQHLALALSHGNGNGNIFAAGMVGSLAGDMMGVVALAIEMAADAIDIGKTIHPHPMLGESIGMAVEVAHGSCTDFPRIGPTPMVPVVCNNSLALPGSTLNLITLYANQNAHQGNSQPPWRNHEAHIGLARN